MSNNFLEIDHDTTDIVKSIKFFLPFVQWEWKWDIMYVANNFTTVGKKICQDDKKLLNPLVEKFGATLRLFNFPNQTVYRWHKDIYIGCSLNMVFHEYNCHTLFNKEFYLGQLLKVEELKYIPNRFYLFNSQCDHTVINLDERDRTLVTLNFPIDVTFNDVKNWYENDFLQG